MSKVTYCIRYFALFVTIAACGLASSSEQVAAAPEHVATAAICDAAALRASRETGVPIDVMRAISLTETGRNGDSGFLPWPWTVNMEGVGKWFDDLQTAQKYVDQNFERGARSFDIGCFQINYRWHGQAFSSIEEMFEPDANAQYAAEFLQRLYNELGDWTKAAGAYHSRTPKYANRYKARFNRIRSRLTDLPDVQIAEVQAPKPAPQVIEVISRINRFPLLVRGGTTTSGSLVPLAAVAPTRLIDLSGPRPILDLR